MKSEAKTALITGGSKGLGRALALELAARGIEVVLVARHEKPLNEVVEEIRARGGRAHALVADVGSTAPAALAGEAHALVGPIDILVNNASTLGPLPMSLLLDTDPADLRRVLEVNLIGPFGLTRRIAGSMLLRDAGTIVFISSDAAVEAYPTWGSYGVSKAAADQLARIWAAELEGTGVRITSFDPGEMNTQMHADAIPDADPSTLARPEDVAVRLADELLDRKEVAA